MNRRYQVMPDQAYCLQPGCSWRENGSRAEELAAAHHTTQGHEVHVLTGSKVIFTSRQPAPAATRA